MTSAAAEKRNPVAILLLAEDAERASTLRAQLAMVLPQCSVQAASEASLLEGQLPAADVAVVDVGPGEHRASADSLRLLRARGFAGAIVVVNAAPDESNIKTLMDALGAVSVPRAVVDATPTDLGGAIATVIGGESTASAQLTRARRVFAAGEVVLSLQHSINNPLAALLAEAQLLQLEELSTDQRAAVDRMVELCRRIIVLVRRLDTLAGG